MVHGIVMKKDAAIKVEGDPKLRVTPWGGLALVEQVSRQTGLWRMAHEVLPQRVKRWGYSSVSVVSSLVYGLLQGGRGFQAAEALRADETACRMLGLHDGVPEEATVYRAMCDLAGLPKRLESEVYSACTHSSDSAPEPARKRGRRKVDGQEPAQYGHRLRVLGLLRRYVARLLPGLPKAATRIGRFTVAFGDATQLEVTGRCFDAAERDYAGNLSLQWLTLWLGPLVVLSQVRGGARDEANGLAQQFRAVHEEVVKPTRTRAEDMLALMDSAYGEEQVLKQVERVGWHYISGLRNNGALHRCVAEQPATQWVDTGAQPQRGWVESAVCAIHYCAESWSRPRVVIVRRFRQDGHLLPEYRFLVTNLDLSDVAAECRRWHCSYAEAIWRLYDHKQAREVQFKTALSDLGLHHPPSGRLGCNQVFYAIAALALNLAMAVSWVALPEQDKGMRLWRMRAFVFAIAARVQRHARQVRVWLSGPQALARRQLWSEASRRIAMAW